MPAGRPSKPTRLKELAGNPGKRALNKAEPKPTGILAPPKTLSKDATAIWRHVVGAMPTGVFTSVDQGLLTAYCEAYATHQRATIALKTEPLMVTGSTGQMVVSPWVKLRADQARLMITLSARLGFDPISRAHLAAPNGDGPADEFAGLIN
jgi:P27 family predicted phage terminase small subunit